MESPLDRAGSDVDWDALYRTGETPWDRGVPHPALVWWLNDNPVSGSVLVPGCGLGHDVRTLAAQRAEVTGLDLSPTAVEAAMKLPRTGHEKYVEGDFFRRPNNWSAAFNTIFEHTCFCAINPTMRDDYARAAARLLKPGGLLLAIFFLDPGVEDGPPFGCTTEELDALFATDFTVVREERDIPTYPGREGREALRLLRRKSGV